MTKPISGGNREAPNANTALMATTPKPIASWAGMTLQRPAISKQPDLDQHRTQAPVLFFDEFTEIIPGQNAR